MIQVSGLNKSFGVQTVLKDAQFSMGTRDRIAFIGRNGHGKSTLFRILMKEETADSGHISIPKNYTIGMLDQHISFSQVNVLDEAFKANPLLEDFELYIAEKILFGLGFSHEQLYLPPENLSSGFKLRLELAKVLIRQPSLLLLDEPTNYLDIVSTRWLVKFLNQYDGEVIAISHDRKFLDAISTHTMIVHRHELKKIPGKIDDLLGQIAMEDEIYEKTRQNLEKKRQEVEKFIERFRAKASKAKQVQSRIKSLNKQEILDKRNELKDMGLFFDFMPINSKNLLSVNDLTFGYEADKPLIQNLSFLLKKGTRLGVIGKNGKGKSTLLKLICGQLNSDDSIEISTQINMSYFGQDEIEKLFADHSIEDEIRIANPDLPYARIRAICGAMLFEGDMAKKKVEVLSGGERARVVLGKIMAMPGHILLLDEPTNHLDVESIDVLAHCLDAYEGAVVIVSHDEDFIEQTCDELIVFDGDMPFKFEGDYPRFLQKIGWQDEQLESGNGKKKLSKKEMTHRRQEIIKEKSKIIRPYKQSVEKLEKKLLQQENELKTLHDLLVNPKGDTDIAEISKKVGELEKLVERNFDELVANQNKVDEIEQSYDNQLNELEC